MLPFSRRTMRRGSSGVPALAPCRSRSITRPITPMNPARSSDDTAMTITRHRIAGRCTMLSPRSVDRKDRRPVPATIGASISTPSLGNPSSWAKATRARAPIISPNIARTRTTGGTMSSVTVRASGSFDRRSRHRSVLLFRGHRGAFRGVSVEPFDPGFVRHAFRAVSANSAGDAGGIGDAAQRRLRPGDPPGPDMRPCHPR
jgi:hypothetical protein